MSISWKSFELSNASATLAVIVLLFAIADFARARGRAIVTCSASKGLRSATLGPLDIVAFGDPNDLLTYGIPPWYVRDVGTLNLHITKVTMQNATHWLGLCEMPTSAHGNYMLKDSPAWRLVRCGAQDGSVDVGPILVTGAAGQLGSVGRTVAGLLLDRGFRVRAMVRREDERAATLRAAGAQVVVGDLLDPGDVYRVVSGCGRVYFGMSVSAGYLEATVTMAAVAREAGVNALVNMSQMTVSEMSPVTEWLSIGGSAGIGFETAHRAPAEGAKVCNQR